MLPNHLPSTPSGSAPTCLHRRCAERGRVHYAAHENVDPRCCELPGYVYAQVISCCTVTGSEDRSVALAAAARTVKQLPDELAYAAARGDQSCGGEISESRVTSSRVHLLSSSLK